MNQPAVVARQLKRRHRCPYCEDEVVEGGLACPVCEGISHQECIYEHPTCCACGADLVQPLQQARNKARARGSRRLLQDFNDFAFWWGRTYEQYRLRLPLVYVMGVVALVGGVILAVVIHAKF